jgi:hypothetical protein
MVPELIVIQGSPELPDSFRKRPERAPKKGISREQIAPANR